MSGGEIVEEERQFDFQQIGSKFQLSAHKLCICLMINEVLTNKQLLNVNKEPFIKFLFIHVFAKRIEEERYIDISNGLREICGEDKLLPNIVEYAVANVTKLDDIYVFFKKDLNSLGVNMDTTGTIDLYIRRCVLAFHKMMFNELADLFDNFMEYKNPMEQTSSRGIESSIIIDEYAHQKVFKLDVEITSSSYKQINKSLESLQNIDFPPKHLLKGINDVGHGKLKGVDEIHNYFSDFGIGTLEKLELGNMKYKDDIDLAYSKQLCLQMKFPYAPNPNATKLHMHNPLLNIGAIHFRYGHIDTALLAITEAIKLAHTYKNLKNNKNKHNQETIIPSLFWLQQIIAQFGFPNEERIMMEHILLESENKSENGESSLSSSTERYSEECAYLFIITILNYVHLETLYSPTHGTPLTSQLNRQFQGYSNWPELLRYSHMKLLNLLENSVAIKGSLSPVANYFQQLNALHHFVPALNLLNYGGNILLPKINFSVVSAYYSNGLRSPDAANYALQYALTHLSEDIETGFYLFSSIAKICPELLQTEAYLTLLLGSHKMRLNRYDFTSAGLIEQMISQYIINKFDPTLLCLLWECKANRLLKSGNYKEAFISFTKLIKYSQNHALIQATFNFHLQIAKIYFKTENKMGSFLEIMKCISIAEELKLPNSSIKAHLYLAQILLHLGLHLDAFHILNNLSEEVERINNQELRAFSYFLTAECILKLTTISTTPRPKNLNSDLLQSCLKHLSRSLRLYNQTNDLEWIREILYLKAMIYNYMGNGNKRKEVSKLFVKVDQQIRGCLNKRGGEGNSKSILSTNINYHGIIANEIKVAKSRPYAIITDRGHHKKGAKGV